ncbi:ExeM/NucH family extracellular endonuclease [Caldimonas brevitalea]|nr:ExeM/NucH family extracellular endonuclease [Caldimonas brevitalea]
MLEVRPMAAALALACLALPAARADVVISQVYGGGGNAGATLTHDFVELFNSGTAPASLRGWSLQYASSTGTQWGNSVALPDVSLQPGQYFLVQLAQGSGGTQALPAPDLEAGLALSASAGKLALVRNTTALSGACPNGGASVADFVGFGSADCAEGRATAALSSTTAALRGADGCTDAGDNSADFSVAVPTPRNTRAPVKTCGSAVNQPIAVNCPALSVRTGAGGSVSVSASDPDSIVNAIRLESGARAGIALVDVSPATGDGGTAGAVLEVARSVPAGAYAVQLRFGNNEAQTASCTVNVQIGRSAVTPIPQIQGTGDASPLLGQRVTTAGVVTAVFPGLKGFYLQDERGDGDGRSSDGVFVYVPAGASVSPGQRVQLSAEVDEFHTVTQLKNVTDLTVLGRGRTPVPTPVQLPEKVDGELEQHEGMLVSLAVPMTVSQNYFLGRYGQLTLSAQGRLEKATNRFRPGSAAARRVDEANARRRLLLDDGSAAQNPTPMPYLGRDQTVRAGDRLHRLTGVIDHGPATADAAGPRDYKLHPTQPPVIERVNDRTAAPPAVGGKLRVASFNVLNYFVTVDQPGAACLPSGTRSDCRGADSALEFTRQRDKILAALTALDADVVGLIEMQRDQGAALQDLVDGLNARLGAGTYAVVPDPAEGVGTDAIRVAMIYKPVKVSRVGAALSDPHPVHNRPPLAQAFVTPQGQTFSVVVNHFKSKGCGGASGPDADAGDGQGCFNARRVGQAQQLLRFIDSVKAQARDEDVLVLGDLNAYGREDPIETLRQGGLVDQIARFNSLGYSYVFDGEAGYLDHALATASLSAQVSRAVEWHINADEPVVIDYNTEFKPQDLYAPTPYRSSDHDPVLLGLELGGR